MHLFFGLIVPFLSILFVFYATIINKRNVKKAFIISSIYGVLSFLFAFVLAGKSGVLDITQIVLISLFFLPYLGISLKLLKVEK